MSNENQEEKVHTGGKSKRHALHLNQLYFKENNSSLQVSRTEFCVRFVKQIYRVVLIHL